MEERGIGVKVISDGVEGNMCEEGIYEAFTDGWTRDLTKFQVRE